MKAVSAALVLVLGAALMLWFGNTLNSWVLGGLIGGLAALVLSIPISVMIFSHLARRHDERLRLEVEEEEAFYEAEMYTAEYAELPTGRGRRTIESYAVTEYADDDVDDTEYVPLSRGYSGYYLPEPSSQRLPAPSKRSTPALPAETRSQATNGRRPQRRYYPGLPASATNVTQKNLRSAALRDASMEANDLYENDYYDEEPIPQRRSTRSGRIQRGRASRELTGRHRVRRVVDSIPPQQLPPARSSYDQYEDEEPQTEVIQDPYPSTKSRRLPSTQLSRQSRALPSRPADPSTEVFQKPLVRRAPYVYEDDSVQQELSQQMQRPIRRRSSLRLSHQLDDEEEV